MRGSFEKAPHTPQNFLKRGKEKGTTGIYFDKERILLGPRPDGPLQKRKKQRENTFLLLLYVIP
jgi:hypothetical protein